MIFCFVPQRSVSNRFRYRFGLVQFHMFGLVSIFYEKNFCERKTLEIFQVPLDTFTTHLVNDTFSVIRLKYMIII